MTPEAIAEGLRAAVWPARMQRLSKGPLGKKAEARGADLWLDGGHNPHAARALAEAARSLHARDGRPVTLIVGLLQRKDAAGVFDAFRPLVKAGVARLTATAFSSELAATPEDLATSANGMPVQIARSPEAALDLALAEDGPPPHVIICGSLYLAGEVLSMSRETWPD